MLSLHAVSYRYPAAARPALRDITFQLNEGEHVWLGGAAGAGKATLAYVAAGFIPHHFGGDLSGEVRLDSLNLIETPLGEWVTRAGIVLSEPRHQITGARPTVLDEIVFGLEPLGLSREEMAQRARRVMAQLGLGGHADRDPMTLSGGEMQRVALAAIVVREPRLLLLVGPMAQLDAEGRATLAALLAEGAGMGQATILASSRLQEAPPHTARGLVLADGALVADAPLAALRDDADLPAWGIEPLRGAREALATQSPLPIPPLPPYSVEIEGVSLRYPTGVAALNDVTLRLDPGTITALVGPNGAGKSTLARTINALLRPTAGRVRVGEWAVANRAPHEMAQRVGMLFQHPEEQLFLPTVRAEVAFAPTQLGLRGAALAESVERALALTALTSHADTHPYDLHPALRRWVALAGLIAQGASVWLLDEPTNSLDWAGRRRLAALLHGLRHAGATVLLISHDRDFVTALADYTVTLSKGTVEG